MGYVHTVHARGPLSRAQSGGFLMTASAVWARVGFTALISILLALDLLVLARGARELILASLYKTRGGSKKLAGRPQQRSEV
jgi:hypothetical protein